MYFIESDSKDAAFYFSVEEYFMYRINAPLVMIWQTSPCVMLGRYQVAAAEINMDYAKQENIQIVRRSSGGGTIFTDEGTFLYTVIGTGLNPQEAKEAVADLVIKTLGKLNLSAELRGRNDILIFGRKISGIAQHSQNGYLCSHGSILYSADLETLTRVLRVDDEKIRTKAIRSVRCRVGNLRDYSENPYSTEEFKTLFRENFFARFNPKQYVLTGRDYEIINQIRGEKYANTSWTFGSSPKFSFRSSRRFDNGRLEIHLDILKGNIEACNIFGDFLGIIPIQSLENHLVGKMFSYQSLDDALDGISLEQHLGGITKEQFLSCVFDGYTKQQSVSEL